MTEFGKIFKIDIREIWKNEETDFTPWLSKNIDRLGEVLGMELEIVEREAEVGDYSLDLLARDTGRNKYVIIENQYGNTDHNKSIFDRLYMIKDDFHKLYGEELTWERLDDKRASRIAIYREGSIDSDFETLEQIKMWMVEKLLKFKEIVTKNKKIKDILSETNKK